MIDRVKLAGLAALMLLAIGAAAALPVGQWTALLVDRLRDGGALGVGAFAGVYIVATVLLFPGALLTAGAGIVYGPWWGTLVVSPVSVAAATAAFALGRTLARQWVAGRIAGDPKFKAVDAAIARHGFKVVLLLRLSPLFPFNVLNYALGLTGVQLRDYVAGSFVGMLPGTFLYVYAGSLIGDVATLSSGTGQVGAARQILSVVGLVATIAVVLYVTRLARRTLADELNTQGALRSEDVRT